MKFRMGAALVAAAALCACNNSGDKNEAGANNSAGGNSTGGNSASASTNSSAASSTPADPRIAEDVRMAAELIRPQLPMRQANGVTLTDVEARGSELILEMRLPNDMDQARFAQLEQQLPQIACNNPQARETFRRGGTYTYRVVDSGGETFTASVNRCAS